MFQARKINLMNDLRRSYQAVVQKFPVEFRKCVGVFIVLFFYERLCKSMQTIEHHYSQIFNMCVALKFTFLQEFFPETLPKIRIQQQCCETFDLIEKLLKFKSQDEIAGFLHKLLDNF